MKILGHRLLVKRVKEEKKEGFQTVEVQDNFVNKGEVVMIGYRFDAKYLNLEVGDIVLFAKYSPDTHEIEHEGEKMKVINSEDVIAIL